MSVNINDPRTPYDRARVLLRDPYCVNALLKELDYLLSLDPDKLLAGFRETAGLDMKGKVRYGGWENLLIGGHTMGHYLTAMAQAAANPGTPEESRTRILETLEYTVSALKECQDHSPSKKGFLFGGIMKDPARPELQFDLVEQGKTDIFKESWVPWYTLHKILAGLLSVYEETGNKTALEVAKGIGDWAEERACSWSEETHRTVLNIEFGGMNDALYTLYEFTGDERYAATAHKFDDPLLYEKIASGEKDVLNNHHANTTIPKFIGAAMAYHACHGKAFSAPANTSIDSDSVLVDASKYLKYAEAFWDMVTTRHTYANGGNSEWEHFGADYILNAERTNCNNETCNVYNMLKLTRLLWEETGNIKYLQYYENAFLNTILSSQNPETGMTTYFQPMATGYFRTYGTPFNSFWCCTGSGMENFTKLQDSIYFRTDNTICVNLYLDSVLTDCKLGICLEQKGDLTREDKMEFTLSSLKEKCRVSENNKDSGCSGSSRNSFGSENDSSSDIMMKVSVAFRIPDYLDGPMTVFTPQGEVTYNVQNGFAVVEGSYPSGTTFTVTLPKTLRAENLPDGENVLAFRYGPYLLSADLGTEKEETGKTGVDVTIAKEAITPFEEIRLTGAKDREDFTSHLSDYFTLGRDAQGHPFFTLKDTGSGTEDSESTLRSSGLTYRLHYLQYKNRYGIYFPFRFGDQN